MELSTEKKMTAFWEKSPRSLCFLEGRNLHIRHRENLKPHTSTRILKTFAVAKLIPRTLSSWTFRRFLFLQRSVYEIQNLSVIYA
jgi:hypothetical protein